MHSSLLSCNYNVRPKLSHIETIIETVGPKLVPVANFNLYVMGQKYQYFGNFLCFYKFSNVESSNRITYFTNRYSFTCFETFQNTTAENRTIIEPPPYLNFYLCSLPRYHPVDTISFNEITNCWECHIVFWPIFFYSYS